MLIYQRVKIVIFHSYVSLPEGNYTAYKKNKYWKCVAPTVAPAEFPNFPWRIYMYTLW